MLSITTRRTLSKSLYNKVIKKTIYKTKTSKMLFTEMKAEKI